MGTVRMLKAAMTLLLAAAVVLPAATLVLAAPGNDNFDSATVISALPFSDTADVSGATAEPDEPWPWYCGNSNYGSIWYHYTPATSAWVQFDTQGGATDAVVTVFLQTGPGFAGLAYQMCSYWPAGFVVRLQAGATYYIQLSHPEFNPGPLQLNMTEVPAPSNDDFVNATPILSLPFEGDVNPELGTMETGEPIPSCVGSMDRSVWYRFDPDAAGSFTIHATSYYGRVLGVYAGTELAGLTEVTCREFIEANLTFPAEAGTVYYFQLGFQWGGYWENSYVHLTLDVAPPPQPSFWFWPSDPSVFEALQFYDSSWDPGEAGIQSQAWDFGDGTTATGCCPTHRYAVDGDYTVTLTVTTTDGRTASTSQVVAVRTHDVAIVKLAAPQSARAGQTRPISIELKNSRYPETVEVLFFRSSIANCQWVGTLNQYVPVRPGNRTTSLKMSYTFTPEDAAVGKVTFKAVATIVNRRDALPGDNEAVSPPTRVMR